MDFRITDETKYNLFCYKIAKETMSASVTIFLNQAPNNLHSYPPTFKNKCVQLITASKLALKAALLCLPLINKIPQLISKEAVIAAIKKDGMLLKYTPSLLKEDKEVVQVATHQNAFAVEYASKDLNLLGEFI